MGIMFGLASRKELLNLSAGALNKISLYDRTLGLTLLSDDSN